MAKPTGIRARHARTCRSKGGGRCNCDPSYEAWVWSPRDQRKIRKTFATEAAARRWRSDAFSAVSRGGMRASTPTTVREAGIAYIAGMRDGTIRNRSGEPYKPSVIRGYERALEQRIYREFGPVKLSELNGGTLQAYVDRLVAEGMDPSTIRGTLMPLRAICRRACRPGGEVLVNPTRGLEIPASRGKRDRIATPEEAARLIELLPRLLDRTLWAVAFYAGLRVGELLALRWRDIDLAAGLIRVREAYDAKEHAFIAPKSKAGVRNVPIAAMLRDYLVTWKHVAGGDPDALAFGRTAEEPFNYSALCARASRAWRAVDARTCEAMRRDGKPCGIALTGGRRYCGLHRDQAPADLDETPTVQPILLHEARHTFASLMIAAGVNAKALSVFVGHSSIQVTFDLYGHLMPGSEAEAAALLDAYLERANTQARRAQIEAPMDASAVAALDDRAPVVRQSDTETGGSERISADELGAEEWSRNGLIEPETA
jgi:integrase